MNKEIELSFIKHGVNHALQGCGYKPSLSLKTRLPTLWTNSYFVSTVGGAPKEAVKLYIENQERAGCLMSHLPRLGRA